MREVDRVGVIREVLGRRLRQGEASERLGICVRQVKRLVRRYREEGARGLRSRRRGRRASNAIAPELRREILGVVRERYEDFAPTLAWEKLTEVHGYGVSVETLRKWMVAEGLWRSKKRPGARVHQSRPRRPALVWCLTNTVMKMRGHFGCRQGAMTCRGGFQTRPCGVHHARKSNATNASRWPQKPPRTPTASCSMTRPPSTSSSPSIPPESSAAISPAVTTAASTRSKARAAATVSVAPPSPSVKASTAPSPSSAKARPSTTECSLKASRPSPQTTKKASAVPSTRPAPFQRKRPRYKPSPDHPWNRWARLHPAPSTPAP